MDGDIGGIPFGKDIDPYNVLDLQTSATPGEVKTAYKRLALKHHPDKVAAEDRPSANARFQKIAFAYAILSDESRRSRFDATGSTSESLSSDDINWSSYFKAQYAELVTVGKLDQLKYEYQGSEKEKHDILSAYTKNRGNMNKVFGHVNFSNVLDDEDRFDNVIRSAIEGGKVQAYDAYSKESRASKAKRRTKAENEASEAQEHAKETLDPETYDSLFGDRLGKRQRSLADMIQERQKARAEVLQADLDNMEERYGKKPKRPKTSSQRSGEAFEVIQGSKLQRQASKAAQQVTGSKKMEELDEPPEEAFQAMAARKKNKAASAGEATAGPQKRKQRGELPEDVDTKQGHPEKRKFADKHEVPAEPEDDMGLMPSEDDSGESLGNTDSADEGMVNLPKAKKPKRKKPTRPRRKAKK